MVVSGGSEHALTVLWMGRWFSGSLISVPPLQETVPVGGTSTTEGEFLHGTRASVHRESSPKFHPSSCDPFCQQVCSRVLLQFQLKYKDKEEGTFPKSHVDHFHRWISHGGYQFPTISHLKPCHRDSREFLTSNRTFATKLHFFLIARRDLFQRDRSWDCIIRRFSFFVDLLLLLFRLIYLGGLWECCFYAVLQEYHGFVGSCSRIRFAARGV